MVRFQLALFAPGQAQPFWKSAVVEDNFGAFCKGDGVFFNGQFKILNVSHALVPSGTDFLHATALVIVPGQVEGDDPVPWPW